MPPAVAALLVDDEEMASGSSFSDNQHNLREQENNSTSNVSATENKQKEGKNAEKGKACNDDGKEGVIIMKDGFMDQ